ncbi:ABC transporter substrate-binding protein [Agrobacterium sp. T29]|uniref:ABC transporter substrate-binding protein n=1 Tax=Agrobacterium sp. T29 TaxID=2580515 RepID=UPI00143DDF08|nr:ABC transporter substrate-binding protein [Agrobacterium sp. T29]
MVLKVTRRSALALAGAAFGALSTPAILRAQTSFKVRIGYNTAVDFVGTFLAEDQGIFKKHGVSVELSPVGPTAMVPAVATNSVDMVTLSCLPTIQAIDAGLPLTILAGAQVLPSTGNIGMMARAGAGLKEPSDLFGRRLAVPALNNIMLYMFNYWFSQKGLDYKKLKWVEAPAVNYRDMMKRGEIDAALVFDPYYQMMKNDGTAVDFINFYENAPAGVVVGGYQANAEWAKGNPEAVAAFRAALEEGTAIALKDNVAARTSISKWTKMAPEIVETIKVPNLLPRITPSNLTYIMDVMRQQNLLKTDITAEKVILRWPV